MDAQWRRSLEERQKLVLGELTRRFGKPDCTPSEARYVTLRRRFWLVLLSGVLVATIQSVEIVADESWHFFLLGVSLLPGVLFLVAMENVRSLLRDRQNCAFLLTYAQDTSGHDEPVE